MSRETRSHYKKKNNPIVRDDDNEENSLTEPMNSDNNVVVETVDRDGKRKNDESVGTDVEVS